MKAYHRNKWHIVIVGLIQSKLNSTFLPFSPMRHITNKITLDVNPPLTPPPQYIRDNEQNQANCAHTSNSEISAWPTYNIPVNFFRNYVKFCWEFTI